MEEHPQKVDAFCPYCKPRKVPEEAIKIEKDHDKMEWPMELNWEKSLKNLHKIVNEGDFKNFAFVYEHEVKADGELVYMQFRSIFGTRDERYEDEAAIVINQIHSLLSRVFRTVSG